MNLHSLSIAPSPASAREQPVRKENRRTLSPVLSSPGGRWVDFCRITRRRPRVVPAAQGSGMCSLCTELTFPFFAPLLLRKLPGPTLQFHSTSFNFLTERGRLGGKRCTQPSCLPIPPHPPASPSNLPLVFISLQKSRQVWISYFRRGQNPSLSE